MEKFRQGIISAAAFSLIIFSLNAAWGGGLAPEEVIMQYYRALQNRDFPKAYRCISKEMRADKDEAKWAEIMKNLFEGGQIVIMDISVSPGTVSGQEAKVNTVITSRDISNKNGLIEYNQEYLVLEDGIWKIDRTELEDSKIIKPPLP